MPAMVPLGAPGRQPYDGGTMEPPRHVHYCPRCGHGRTPSAELAPDGPFRCDACAFTLYFNPAAAVAGIVVREDGRALFIRRAKEPGKGKLAMAGGFVDAGENAEDALRREVREEVGLETRDLRYLSSHPNQYFYLGVTYHTLDLFFVASAEHPDDAAAGEDVQHLVWLDPLRVPLEDLAFDSMRQALRIYRRSQP